MQSFRFSWLGLCIDQTYGNYNLWVYFQQIVLACYFDIIWKLGYCVRFMF